MKAFIFDLDGVVVDTAHYHYLAWKKLAKDLGFLFEQIHNEKQKGISRMESLEVVLEVGNIKGMTKQEKIELATKKNEYYLEMIEYIDERAILPGVLEFMGQIKKAGYPIALGSASKSGGMILDKLRLRDYFNVVVDGNLVSTPKPDPEVFIKAADLMGIPYAQCIVVEDAKAGIEAARRGHMKSIGVGDATVLKEADIVVANTGQLPRLKWETLF